MPKHNTTKDRWRWGQLCLSQSYRSKGTIFVFPTILVIMLACNDCLIVFYSKHSDILRKWEFDVCKSFDKSSTWLLMFLVRSTEVGSLSCLKYWSLRKKWCSIPIMAGGEFNANGKLCARIIFPHDKAGSIFAAIFIRSWRWQIYAKAQKKIKKLSNWSYFNDPHSLPFDHSPNLFTVGIYSIFLPHASPHSPHLPPLRCCRANPPQYNSWSL